MHDVIKVPTSRRLLAGLERQRVNARGFDKKETLLYVASRRGRVDVV